MELKLARTTLGRLASQQRDMHLVSFVMKAVERKSMAEHVQASN